MDPVVLTEAEREELRTRILGSVRSLNTRRRRARYALGMAMAASLAIIAGLVFLRESPTATISDFARTTATVDGKGTDKVVLVLDGGE
ncbi:hypothetical protein SAMN03080602_04132, partial [Arenibacter troitsensis]